MNKQPNNNCILTFKDLKQLAKQLKMMRTLYMTLTILAERMSYKDKDIRRFNQIETAEFIIEKKLLGNNKIFSYIEFLHNWNKYFNDKTTHYEAIMNYNNASKIIPNIKNVTKRNQ